MTEHSATAPTPVESIPHSAGAIQVQGFVLPHRDRMTSAEFHDAEGPLGWQAHEGFFVYRGRRLLVPGGWLGLGPVAGGPRTAYTASPASASIFRPVETWTGKSTYANRRPFRRRRCAAVCNPSRTVSDATHARSLRSVQVLEPDGNGNRLSVPGFQCIRAAVFHTRSTVCTPTVMQALDSVGEQRHLVENMLAVVEATVPVQRIWIDVSESTESTAPGVEPTLSTDESAALSSLYRHMRIDLELGADQARARLMALEPFCSYPEAIQQLPDTVSP